ncbi:hypothetical protein ACN2WE_37475 [Streptomyces sp. cg28]
MMVSVCLVPVAAAATPAVLVLAVPGLALAALFSRFTRLLRRCRRT